MASNGSTSMMTRRYVNLEIDGQKFRIQSINAKEWRQYLRRLDKLKKDGVLESDDEGDSLLLVLCLVGADESDPETFNKPIYTVDDLASLDEMDMTFFRPLSNTCITHNGLNRSINDAVKNSEATPTSSST